jgi:DNA polymerase III alpha subunit
MGIVKVDLLGLGMMAVLQDAIELINIKSQNPNPKSQFDLARLPPDDPAVYDLLQKADTVGVFQVESRAQMATLPRLKPACFYDLVVEVAIIRPGPIVGDMVHPYLNRRAGREQVVPLHPSLEPVLARTLGVPLFQEQLLRMAMVAAGFTGGQAEELRRAMGFKRSEKRMKQIEVQLREGMARNGIFPSRTPPASRCWRMRAHISRCTIPRRSIRRSSTTSRWGSITPRRSSRTLSAAAYGSIRSMCSSRTGCAGSKRTAVSVSGSCM